jgi:hypothetical protein
VDVILVLLTILSFCFTQNRALPVKGLRVVEAGQSTPPVFLIRERSEDFRPALRAFPAIGQRGSRETSPSALISVSLHSALGRSEEGMIGQ